MLSLTLKLECFLKLFDGQDSKKTLEYNQLLKRFKKWIIAAAENYFSKVEIKTRDFASKSCKLELKLTCTRTIPDYTEVWLIMSIK